MFRRIVVAVVQTVIMLAALVIALPFYVIGFLFTNAKVGFIRGSEGYGHLWDWISNTTTQARAFNVRVVLSGKDLP